VRVSVTLSLFAVFAKIVLGDDTALAIPSAEGPKDSIQSLTSHSWELPTRTVHGNAGQLRENRRIGSYSQPLWSARRLFSEVRTYVIPEGQFEFEYWLFLATPSRKAADSDPEPKNEVKQVYEAEMGLGHHLQFDLYQVYVKDGSDGKNVMDATKFEMRYAFADWGVLWGNPTAYAEWEQAAEGDDAFEGKLLLCGELTARTRWASNLVWEEKTGGTRERNLEFNNALSFVVRDEKLSLGIELAAADVSELKAPGGESRDHTLEFSVGPSLRFYPVPHAHVILSEFLGLNETTGESKSVGIIGWEF